MEELLKALQPSLTIIAALFAAFLFFARSFWFFLNYEGKLREENLGKVKELNLKFRKKHIEIKVRELYSKTKSSGFQWGLDTAVDSLYNTDAITGQKTLKTNADIEVALASKSAWLHSANADISTESDQFAYSDVGESFFNALDNQYDKKNKINLDYRRMKFACRTVILGCLLLCTLMILGIWVQAANFTEQARFVWLFSSIVFFIFSLVFCTLLFYYRFTLSEAWEQEDLYGEP